MTLLGLQGNISPLAAHVLSQAFDHNSVASPVAIIMTNFRDLIVFFPPTPGDSQPSFEIVSTTQFSLALQVVSAACMHRTLPLGSWIQSPDSDIGYKSNLRVLEGPPQDPNRPLLTDDEVLATHQRHSDFDMVTLVRDPSRALQFFRWHDQIQHRYSKVVIRPNDVLDAVTNTLSFMHPPLRPIYPFDARELPADTITHLKETQRQSPLKTAGLMESFMHSKSFTVKILDVVAEGSTFGICTVYRCQITSIDGHSVSMSPSLCLKLFDDRFQGFQYRMEEEVDELIAGNLHWWFDQVLMAETLVTNETLAYDKLLSFMLPDGITLYGILMEYIDGWALDSNAVVTMSPKRQIKMIQSCHHSVRVLDVGDINQCDWHSKQILLYTNPTTNLDHAILIDFALTTQTYEEENRNYLANYKGIFDILFDAERSRSKLLPELVLEHFGPPHDWDPINASIPLPWNEDRYRDMFPFISFL
ncbi:hypothetical protein C0995_012646 [Termitomyces sp. Mi166|nr:hypothetical protein C0995_012646 [Termitomyces sp. Mi166\